MVRYRPDLGRQLRDGETGTASCIHARLERAVYWADRLLQHDLAARAAAVAQAEQNRCSHGGMTGERQFPTRGKDANARAVRSLAGGKDEHRLGVIELVRDGLHAGSIETVGIEHDRERIAGEAAISEHVKRDETPAHRPSHRPSPRRPAASHKNDAWRDITLWSTRRSFSAPERRILPERPNCRAHVPPHHIR